MFRTWKQSEYPMSNQSSSNIIDLAAVREARGLDQPLPHFRAGDPVWISRFGKRADGTRGAFPFPAIMIELDTKSRTCKVQPLPGCGVNGIRAGIPAYRVRRRDRDIAVDTMP